LAWNNKENIVKFRGECWNRGRHKYCSYWRAEHSILTSGRRGLVRGYRYALFEENKVGYASLPQCNTQYGRTYDGRK